MEPMADHDSSYRLFFSHPEMVRDLLIGFVDEKWVADTERRFCYDAKKSN